MTKKGPGRSRAEVHRCKLSGQRFSAFDVQKLNSFILLTSFLMLSISFWNRNELPGNIDLQPAVLEAPKQTRSSKEPFEVEFNGIHYKIEPQYEYDLHGMIVSYRHHDGKSRMHRRSNDHLNMLDVCVVWGENAAGDHLRRLSFWNGIFTCNVKTRDLDAWNQFRMNELSNNHLLSDNDFVRDQVSGIAIGDQIRVRGWLAGYSNDGGGQRGTSTTREDTGDGACETIFIERFDILEPALNYWRLSMYASLTVLLLTLIRHFRSPYRPHPA